MANGTLPHKWCLQLQASESLYWVCRTARRSGDVGYTSLELVDQLSYLGKFVHLDSVDGLFLSRWQSPVSSFDGGITNLSEAHGAFFGAESQLVLHVLGL